MPDPVTTSNGRETLGDPGRSNFEIDTTTSHNGHAVTESLDKCGARKVKKEKKRKKKKEKRGKKKEKKDR
ncbi:hypothetical protein ANTPLA_LOCUS6504 [Anthophora plagiata]